MASRFTDTEKAEFLADLRTKGDLGEYFDYLDNLRASGATNMFGAGAYLQEDYELSRAEASAVLTEWMHAFSRDKTAAERASA